MKLADLLASVLAGFAIGIGAAVYLTVGGIIGAFMFSVGLASVLFYRFPLFTGQAWKIWGKKGLGWLFIVFCCNIVGACVAPVVFQTEIALPASAIIQSRVAQGFILCGLKAIPCGFLMTAAVRASASKNWWPLLLGVPTFILCGFPHCIADVSYVCCCDTELALNYFLTIYPAIVIGNYLGCNLFRLAGVPKVKE